MSISFSKRLNITNGEDGQFLINKPKEFERISADLSDVPVSITNLIINNITIKHQLSAIIYELSANYFLSVHSLS